MNNEDVDIYNEREDIIIKKGKMIYNNNGITIRTGDVEITNSRTMFVSNENGEVARVPLESINKSNVKFKFDKQDNKKIKFEKQNNIIYEFEVPKDIIYNVKIYIIWDQ
jgi:hypothetical protein